MIDRSTEQFTLTLLVEGGRMPLTFFASTTADLQKLLRAIGEAHLGEAVHTEWDVESDHIQIVASVNGVSAQDLESIINDAYQSLKAEDAKDIGAIPPTVNDKGRRLTRSIVNRIKRTVPVTVDVPGQEPIHIESTPIELHPVQVPYRRRRRELVTAVGAVDGVLDVISVRTKPYFVIYEHGTRNQIRCTFPDEWMETVKDLLGGRVIAEGTLRYRPNGTVSLLTEPTALNPIPEPQRSISELRGALPGISGVLSSVDYVRQLRTVEDRG